jgi:hypothetical protein
MASILGVGLIVFAMASLPSWPVSAQDKTFTAQRCSYWNQDDNKFEDGPCLLRTTTLNGNFGYIVTFGDGTRITIEYVASQSGYHAWKINGRPGLGIEVNRENLKGATMDLKQAIEWDTSAPRGAR